MNIYILFKNRVMCVWEGSFIALDNVFIDFAVPNFMIF